MAKTTVQVPAKWLEYLNVEDAAAAGLAMKALEETCAKVMLIVDGKAYAVAAKAIGSKELGVEFSELPKGYLPVSLTCVVGDTTFATILYFFYQGTPERYAWEALFTFIPEFYQELGAQEEAARRQEDVL